MTANIKKVSFAFEGDDRFEQAMEISGVYRPSDAAGLLMRQFNMRNVGDCEVALALHFNAARRPKILFEVWEYKGEHQPQDRLLSQMDVMIAQSVGPKDWHFYMSQKTDMDREVRAPDAVKINDMFTHNFHDVLAARFQKTLEDKGLAHKWVSCSERDALTATEASATLLGMVLDHREMLGNPQMIGRRLGL